MSTLRFIEADLTFEVDAECTLAQLDDACAERGPSVSFTHTATEGTVGEWIDNGMKGSANPFSDPVAQTLVGLEGTLNDGTRVVLRPCPRRAAGPDLRALFVGQQGLFGRIHRAWLYVGPRKSGPSPAPPESGPLSAAERELRTRMAREFSPRLSAKKETP